MNKYILLLGVAAVALGSCCAYAGNSATMTVTAKIERDVSLTKTGDINLGTITINPAYTGEGTNWEYNDSGIISFSKKGAIVSADNVTAGTFTANIPNPSACSTAAYSCGGLRVDAHVNGWYYNLFGNGFEATNGCDFAIKYSSGNVFKVFPRSCEIYELSTVTKDSHNATLTISYTAGS